MYTSTRSFSRCRIRRHKATKISWTSLVTWSTRCGCEELHGSHFSWVLPHQTYPFFFHPFNLNQRSKMAIQRTGPYRALSPQVKPDINFGLGQWRLPRQQLLTCVLRDDLYSLGKRVIFEDHEEGWLHPTSGDAIVFVPDLFDFQFSSPSFIPYPNCSIQGESNWYCGGEPGRIESFEPPAHPTLKHL